MKCTGNLVILKQNLRKTLKMGSYFHSRGLRNEVGVSLCKCKNPLADNDTHSPYHTSNIFMETAEAKVRVVSIQILMRGSGGVGIDTVQHKISLPAQALTR